MSFLETVKVTCPCGLPEEPQTINTTLVVRDLQPCLETTCMWTGDLVLHVLSERTVNLMLRTANTRHSPEFTSWLNLTRKATL